MNTELINMINKASDEFKIDLKIDEIRNKFIKILYETLTDKNDKEIYHFVALDEEYYETYYYDIKTKLYDFCIDKEYDHRKGYDITTFTLYAINKHDESNRFNIVDISFYDNGDYYYDYDKDYSQELLDLYEALMEEFKKGIKK
jgi:hypothetical protein